MAARTAAPHEIELKFEVAPADLPGLKRRVGAIKGRVGPHAIRRLTTTYFDTDDLTLKANGLSLRVQAEPGRRLQAVKAVGTSGALDRSEWEREIRGSGLDLSAVKDTPIGDLLSSKRARRSLKPVFKTEVKRIVQEIRRDGTVIELALDDASALSGRQRSVFCEVELELKAGDVTGLFAVAHDLSDGMPLRLGVLSKAERGYALREHAAPQAVKAEPPRLTPGMTAADGFRSIVRSCLRQYRLNEAVLLQRRDADALHQARVATRRLRSAFSLFKDIVADRELEAIKAELRWASGPLGRARNHDVFLKRAAAAAETLPEGTDTIGFLDLVRADRERAYDDVLAVLQSTRFTTLMLRLVEWLETGSWTRRARDDHSQDGRLEDTAEGILESRRRKVRKKGKHLDTIDPMARHRVRIQAKKLRYAAEFFAPLYSGKSKKRRHARFVAALKAMQDELGTLNDIATGHGLVAGLVRRRAGAEPAFAGGLIAGAGEAREPGLLQKAAAAHRRLTEAKPFWR